MCRVRGSRARIGDVFVRIAAAKVDMCGVWLGERVLDGGV